MDLLGTDLVVLSACETGIGVIARTEGMFGLRRSFLVAGARTLIVSLWAVPDRATAELMTLFYRNLLDGLPKLTALRAAQQVVRQRRPHVRNWGAFVLIGDSGPIVQPLRAGRTVPDAEASLGRADRSQELA